MAAKAKQFIVLVSECGELSQAMTSQYGKGSDIFPSVKAAKDAVPGIVEDIMDNDGETTRSVWIVEIAATGTANSFAWDK